MDDQLPPMMSPSAQALNRRRSREASGDLDGVDNNSTNGGESSTGAAAPFVLGQGKASSSGRERETICLVGGRGRG